MYKSRGTTPVALAGCVLCGTAHVQLKKTYLRGLNVPQSNQEH